MLEKFFVVLAVAAFIYDPDKGLLIIKKSIEEKVDGGLWTVPGGKVDPEEAIIEALKREIEEEVGLKITKYNWIGEDVFESDEKFFHGEHFLCEVEKGEVLLESKMEDFKWIRKEDVASFEFHPNIKREILNVFDNLI